MRRTALTNERLDLGVSDDADLRAVDAGHADNRLDAVVVERKATESEGWRYHEVRGNASRIAANAAAMEFSFRSLNGLERARGSGHSPEEGKREHQDTRLPR